MTILIIILCIILIALLMVFIAYKESDKIILRNTKRSQITVFPDQLKLEFERVIFKNSDGITLKGWFIPAEQESGKTIVFMHGWGMNKGTILQNTVFLRKKYNLFYFDFRGSGESGEGLSSIGYLEIRDAKAAIEKLIETRPEACKEIGLYGLSMGAAVAIYEGAHNDLVKCVVAEGCYYSYEKVVARWARVHKHTPYFPLVALALYFAKKRLGMDPEEFSPKYNIEKLNGKPVFIINGADDTLSPRHDARKLYRRAKEPKQIWIVPNATHTEVADVAGRQYKNRLSEFYDKYL